MSMKLQTLSSIIAASFISVFGLLGCASPDEDSAEVTDQNQQALVADEAPASSDSDGTTPLAPVNGDAAQGEMIFLGGRESTNVIDCRGCSPDIVSFALRYQCDWRCH